PGYFHITNTSTIVGNIQTVGASGYDYGLSATVNVDNCNLVDDNSSGGWAEGEFAGGAIISLVGDLWDVSTPGTLLIDDGVILQAQMVLTSSQTWTLSEVGGDPRDIDGTMDFIPTNGGLNSGIDLGNGDSLVIGNFRADFGFPNTQPVDPTSFGAISYFAMASTLQMTAIPEPSTVVLLSIGALGFLRKRRG
ncbi:MAG: PEP-CTERM sorting domain-containing protein, partial [Sedimentisphaerales bacterium]|nr:PEP-CTERM sorting domain-containing protein [Sedimentisphaerales bacterium]